MRLQDNSTEWNYETIETACSQSHAAQSRKIRNIYWVLLLIAAGFIAYGVPLFLWAHQEKQQEQTDVSSLQSQIDNLTDREAQDVQMLNTSIELVNATLQNNIDALSKKEEADVESLNQTIANVNSTLQSNIDALTLKEEADVTNLNQTLGVVNATLQSNIDALSKKEEADVASLNQTIKIVNATLQNNIDVLSNKEAADVVSLNQTIAKVNSTLQSNIDALTLKEEADVANLNQTLKIVNATLQSNIDALSKKEEADVVSLNQTIATVNTTLQRNIDTLTLKEENDVLSLNQTMMSINLTSQNDIQTLTLSIATLNSVIANSVPLTACELTCENGGTLINNCTGCQCSTGWTGSTCNVPSTCDTICQQNPSQCSCQHGGNLTSSCKCQCAYGYTGTDCSARDGNVNDQQFETYFAGLVNAVPVQPINPPSESRKAGQVMNLRCNIGTMIDSTTRILTERVAVTLTYSKDPTTANVWVHPSGKYQGEVDIVPNEAAFELKRGITLQGASFTSFSDMLKQFESIDFRAPPAPSLLQINGADKYAADFFTADNLIAEAVEIYPLYQLSLPINTADNRRNYRLDPSLMRAFQQLMDWDASNPAVVQQYTVLFDTLGDSVIIEDQEGGLFDSTNTINNQALDTPYVDPQDLAKAAENDLSQQTGTGSSTYVYSVFTDYKSASASYCMGGNSGVYPCDFSQARSIIPTFPDWPRPVSVKFVPLSDLVSDRKTSINLQQAQFYYSQQKIAKYKNDTCPNCQNLGKCTPPNSYCVCTSKFTGRTCSTCAYGYWGENCNTRIFSLYSPGGSGPMSKSLIPASQGTCALTQVDGGVADYSHNFVINCQISANAQGVWILNLQKNHENDETVSCAAICLPYTVPPP